MKICQWCHEPYNNNGYKYCSEDCAKEAHRAQCRKRAKQHYDTHHEEELARCSRYYEANCEKKKASATKWRQTNHERYNALSRERYRKKKAESQ